MKKAIDVYINNLDKEVVHLKYVADQLKLLNEELQESEGVTNEN